MERIDIHLRIKLFLKNSFSFTQQEKSNLLSYIESGLSASDMQTIYDTLKLDAQQTGSNIENFQEDLNDIRNKYDHIGEENTQRKFSDARKIFKELSRQEHAEATTENLSDLLVGL